MAKAKHCLRLKHQQVSKSNSLMRSFSAIFSAFLLEAASAFNEELCSVGDLSSRLIFRV